MMGCKGYSTSPASSGAGARRRRALRARGTLGGARRSARRSGGNRRRLQGNTWLDLAATPLRCGRDPSAMWWEDLSSGVAGGGARGGDRRRGGEQRRRGGEVERRGDQAAGTHGAAEALCHAAAGALPASLPLRCSPRRRWHAAALRRQARARPQTRRGARSRGPRPAHAQPRPRRRVGLVQQRSEAQPPHGAALARGLRRQLEAALLRPPEAQCAAAAACSSCRSRAPPKSLASAQTTRSFDSRTKRSLVAACSERSDADRSAITYCTTAYRRGRWSAMCVSTSWASTPVPAPSSQTTNGPLPPPAASQRPWSRSAIIAPNAGRIETGKVVKSAASDDSPKTTRAAE